MHTNEKNDEGQWWKAYCGKEKASSQEAATMWNEEFVYLTKQTDPTQD